MLRSVVFYSIMLLAGAALAAKAGLPSLFALPESVEVLVGSLAAAALLALVVVQGGRALEKLDWYRRMARVLGRLARTILGENGGVQEAFVLALASSLGEEALFRGALQPWLIRILAGRMAWGLAAFLGVIASSLAFTAAHPPLHKDLRPWTIFVLVIGLAMGALAAWSGSLAAPVLAHFLINFLNLVRISRESDED